jgi:hypothetical protein
MTRRKKEEDLLPAGRPSKYKEEYCEMLKKHMTTGLSFESFAAVVGVCDDTLREWEKVHPLFSASKKIAFALNRMFWEQVALDGLMLPADKKFNSTVWIFNMKNRFRWKDLQEVESTIKAESNINLTGLDLLELVKATAKKEHQ